MDTFDLKKYLAENILKENDMDNLGKELSMAIEDKLEDKEDINEVVDPISILSYLLAGTTLTNILAKYAGKFFKKYNFGKGEAAAKKIYNFTHKLENDFKSPIKTVLSIFVKDKKSLDLITNGLFAVLLLVLGGVAGANAYEAVKVNNVSTAGMATLKAALKGKDLQVVIADIISGITS